MSKQRLDFNLTVSFLKEDKRFVAYSPALDLSTSGKTFEQAHTRFLEAAQLFFDAIVKDNTVDRVLTDLGWQKQRRVWQPPQIVAEQRQIAVPVMM